MIDPESGRESKAKATRSRLDRVADIPTLPTVLAQVWDLSSREETSAADLGRAMSADPGLTGAILKLANSAYFGFPRKIGTVTQAIVVLGFETVKSLAMGASVFRAIRPGPTSGLDPNEFFRHGLTTALASRRLMELRAPRLAGAAFSAGVLHDLGKLVIAEFLPVENAALQAALAAGADSDAAEIEATGMDHAEIGAWFGRRWSFPAELTAAVRWHHSPESADEHALWAAVVHLGDVAAHRLGAVGCGRAQPPEPQPAALRILGIDETTLATTVDELRSLEPEGEAFTAALASEEDR